MAIDVETPQSPGWWLKKLSDKLNARRATFDDLFRRYEGDSLLPRSLWDAPEAAKRFYRTARTAFAEMIVKAVRYPLKIQSVSTIIESGSAGDLVAWRLMQACGMKHESNDVHRNALIAGWAYAIIGQHEQHGIRYTAEDPREVVTIQDPVVQAESLAALKITHDDTAGRDYAWLYLPGRVYRASRKAGNTGRAPRFSPWSFDWDPEYNGAEGVPLPEGFENTIPVITYRNEEGIGEFQRHRDTLDRVDHLILQGMVIATYQAFKQRGIKVNPEHMPDYDEETGEEINYDDVFSADPGALWKLPESAEMWESGAVDVTPVWTGVDRAIQQLSATTFTPLAMFSPEGQNQTAEGATFAREGRTFKIEDRQDLFGDAHARALSLMLRMAGEEDRADIAGLRVAWKPAERHSLASKADAMSKTRGDLPFRQRVIDIWQASPEEADEMEQLREEELLRSMVADPSALAAGSVPGDGEVSMLEDAQELRQRADTLGLLRRAGVKAEDAAERAGLSGITFIEGDPITIRSRDGSE